MWANGVGGEADGHGKYVLAGAGPQDETAALVAAVHAERARETALRRTGLAVVRWGAADLFDVRRAVVLTEHVRREIATPRLVTARLLDG